MNIRDKLTLAFLSVALIVALVGYYVVDVSETALQAGIGKQSVIRAREMLSRIDASIYMRIEQLQAYADQLAKDPRLADSNLEFEQLEDTYKYIADKDQAWQAAEATQITPFMDGLINSQFSQDIRDQLERKDFYRWRLRYELFSEVFVTNRYGANVAQTQKTTDYYQADELWWREAENLGVYVADVEYDRSAAVYSTDICVRIENKKGAFLGVLKAVVNLQATISPLEDASQSGTPRFRLLTTDNLVIFASNEYVVLEPLPKGLPFYPRKSASTDPMDYFIAKGSGPDGKDGLYAFACSSGFKDYKGHGWVLVVEHDIDTVLAPVAMLKTRALYVLLAVTVFAVILGLLTSRSVSNSLKTLTTAALKIGQGDLSARAQIRSKDEIGQLTRVFNTMAENLQAAMDKLEREIVNRKLAKDALLREKLLSEDYINSLPGLFYVYDEQRLIRWNRQFETVSGYGPEELVEMYGTDFFTGEDKKLIAERMHKVFVEGFADAEAELVTKDGRRIPYYFTGARKTFNGKDYLIGLGVDITDRKRAEAERLSLERQVQHAQKLESLGVLAGGIAHDFNNLLMAILGNADLAMDELARHAPGRDNLKEIEKAAKRAAELSKQMLAYSGKGKFVVETIDLNEFVEEMAHLLEVSISKKVILKYNFADNLPVFGGDAAQIRQIIMNLITNASEAIGDKSGVIALSTGATDCDRAYLDSIDRTLRTGLDEPLPEGLYVYIEVSDTGCGMDDDTIKKIFDPFFTTKFTGRGLGMAAVLGIVRGHGGAISIYSEPGKGTAFKVLFPAGDPPAGDATVRELEQHETKAWRGSGTVLIVDDEETVCAVGKQMLIRMGFDVLVAADGQEAVEVFAAHADDIVCVLLDLTMPHMDGEQAFGELRRIKSDVAVILCSGYNEQDATQHFAGKGLAGFVQKPYSIIELRNKLIEVLADDDQTLTVSEN
ncbi:MAG: response regulator [Phycisphaerae bacterium]|jgi:PAS domain S-box-containing protein|nr:response regulator [Phycisphaerae bacterium]